MTLRVIAGTNNVLLAMDLNEVRRKGCLGFSIERTDIESGERRWLPNMVRFPGDTLDTTDTQPRTVKTPAAKSSAARSSAARSSAVQSSARKTVTTDAAPEAEAPSVSSARAPLQKFRWGDYTLDPGKRYRYRVIPRYGKPEKIIADGKASERQHDFDAIAGGVAVEIRTENNRAPDAAVFFNRGAAASRAYNQRYGDNDPGKIPDALWWLSRGLEEALIGFIGRATDSSFVIHAAIYEFQKPTLLRALKAAKGRGVDVSVVYHGRQKMLKGAADPKDKTTGKNEAAIAQVGIDFAKPRRADPQGAIMHNKFVILLKKDAGKPAQPMAVWTGSTNWTEGAIYGQLNVGHAIFDPNVAATYEKYFQLLHDDASTATMKQQTSVITPVPNKRDAIPHGITPIFSPQSSLAMIDLYAELCSTAKVLMVSAPFALHPKILAAFKAAPKDVVRFLMADKEGSFGKQGAMQLLEHDPGNEVSVATVLKSPLNDFQGALLEGTESFHHAGVHIHSKIIAADPFGTDPILVTGSANFSNNSTVTNDSNSLIIRGDTAVMDVYITEFMRMFEHYWFRAHMDGKTKGGKAKATVAARVMGLKPDDSWSLPFYKPGTRESVERVAFAGLAS